MRRGRLTPWDSFWLILAALYFLLPLYRHGGVQPGDGARAAMASTTTGRSCRTQLQGYLPLSLKLAVATVVAQHWC